MNSKIYFVDSAMMGDFWGEQDNLELFCGILQGVVDGIEIVAVTDSCNGAENFDPDAVTDDEWNTAISIYIDVI